MKNAAMREECEVVIRSAMVVYLFIISLVIIKSCILLYKTHVSYPSPVNNFFYFIIYNIFGA